jgi:hypothetical protein
MQLSKIKFGRRIHFDSRSRKFPIMALIPTESKPRSYTWRCLLNLDQGDAPACVGFSVTHEAAARPVEVTELTNKIALQVYKRAQVLDEIPGEDYEGSSVLGGIKAGVEKKWYGSYRWGFGLDDAILALGYHGPGVAGLNWYSGMMDIDSKGFIHPTGQVEGGHAILINQVNVKGHYVGLFNSWSKSWGRNGSCYLSFDDFARLLKEDGEFCIPVVRLHG